MKISNKSNNNSKKLPGNFTIQLEQKSSKPQLTPPKPKLKIFKPLLIFILTGLFAGVGYGVYRLFFYQSEPEGLFFSGRIEGYETDISAKVGGKVVAMNVKEGDFIKLGQRLVKLDDSQTSAELEGAIAKVRATQQRLKRRQQQLPVMQAQLQQAQYTIEQVTQEAQGKVFEAEKSVDSARAHLVEAESSLQLAKVKKERTARLHAEGAVSTQKLDEDTANLKVRQARVNSAKQQLLAAQGTRTQARATLRNRPIQTAAALQIEKQIAQAHTDIEESEQEVRDSQAYKAVIRAKLNDLVIQSPLAGTVITKTVEIGEVVANGAPLLSIVNLDNLYLRGFIPVEDIGKVKVGQHSLIYLDSAPNKPLRAIVTRIDPKASFTPDNTYFKKDRVTQVFGVELTLQDSQGFAKPGMPADGRIMIPEEQVKYSSQFFPISGYP